MRFSHSLDIWTDFPELAAGVVFADGVTAEAPGAQRLERFYEIARNRLKGQPEGGLPEVQAWRRAFSRMGLKPTQYRSAAESLLRRLRIEGSLPQVHPMVDLCNAVSVAFAVPVAAFDVSRIKDFLEVRKASGSEEYLPFSGESETPQAGEIVFADGAGRAHARRWTHRQSGYSAVRAGTSAVLIVAEAMHPSARTDVGRLVTMLTEQIVAVWSRKPKTGVLSSSAPRFEL